MDGDEKTEKQLRGSETERDRIDDDNPKAIIQEKTVNVANVELAAAVGVEKLGPWGKGHIRLYICCSLIYLLSTMSGYDSSLMGSINALPNYQEYYNLPENGASSTGLVFAIFNIGQMTGSIFVIMADWKGRKFPIFLGCAGVMLGTSVTSLAPTLGVFIGGRFLLSFFANIATTTAPMYMVEIAPPMYRATVSGLYNTLYYLGSILATTAVLGSHLHHAESNLDWRLRLWLQMLCPGFIVIAIWFLPESPRYLVARDRQEEARQFFVKYHANGDAHHPIVALEMDEITRNLKETQMTSWCSFFDLRTLVKTRASRYRLGLNIAFSWFGQFSGNNVVSYYLPLLLTALNITSTNTKLLLNVLYALTGWIAATAGARFHDILGRRKMLLGATVGMVLCLSIVAGTAAGYERNSSRATSSVSVAFIYVFGVVFAFGFTSMQPVYPAEVMSNDMRAKGMLVYHFTSGLAGFVNTFAAPVALKNIRYWFYVFFVFWDAFEAMVIYFFFVETQGRTLEELDEVFEAANPRKESTRRVQVRTRVLASDKSEERVEVVQV